MLYTTPFTEYTGSGVSVAIIDSGVNPLHPHVVEIAGGVNLSSNGDNRNHLDYIGHGTAVAGAIREKAPRAILYAVKVFDQSLRTNVETILQAIEWSIDHEMHVINLSLGTINKSHNERFQQVIARAVAHNIAIVSASEISGEKAWPGCSPHVIGVGLDWECPRDSFGCESNGERITFTTSGYPRSIPGVPPERNLSGISFAVANMTGFVVRAKEAFPDLPVRELESLLAGEGRGMG